ncbi:MAG: zf-TFIIB domain-containing protein [Deltaproteobacteria bacterium]|nr:zf-TFIIB domain-containing protein [Deltaproteobacteria bacterium]MBK8238298.1 zf-TFIIB domain-containing protein [Deltaproteobacteria bacterium]MBP7286012.1 zf-TFIIB domain-containing protein [Nannocystaceae bacterium]
MHCPKCGMELSEITFRGVKVDKCFACGGVWLDDGELEELAGKPGFFEALRRLFAGA